jgi:hypothetical protein
MKNAPDHFPGVGKMVQGGEMDGLTIGRIFRRT